MAYDHGTEVYVHCVYAKITGKHKYLYSIVPHEVIILMEFKGMPKFITTGFEITLIKAIKYEFTESIVSGCYFHLKQALKRKLQKFRLSDTESYTIFIGSNKEQHQCHSIY
ncbi:hypothetical protein HZS_2659 [Henneguya salminicola]|nr:hypothetical protein HZS_2659 [Henneguya salminicola]